MFGKDSILWKKYFGLAWEELEEIAENVGRYAFFIDRHEYELDKNAYRMLGFEGKPSYENVLRLISHIRGDDNAHLVVKSLHSDSATALGFIYEKHQPQGDVLSLCTVNQLISAMTENTVPSLLALLQFESVNGKYTLSDRNIYELLTVLMTSVPKETMLCSLKNGKLWLYIPAFSGGEIQYLTELKESVEEYELTSPDNEAFHATFTAGCSAELSSPMQRMNTAQFTLFEAQTMGMGTVLNYSVERYEDQKNEFARIQQFTTLLDSNLFRYHFQPIISAHNGEIIAYEMLMRSGGGIEMYPLEILSLAEKYDRLYDIEKATFFNALHFISENQQQFSSKKLFVNSIGAHILTDDDWRTLETDYGELLEKVVIELTEQSEIDDARLTRVKNRIAQCNMELAIDDYGTGYSNTSNLLRYSPSYVKIDRQLIAGIDTNLKMQKLVSSIIEFVHDNGYQALAEGVETYSELKTMIGLGSDLIQGFYVSKPKPFMLYEISDVLRDEIIKINLEYSSNIDKIYHPKNCETVDLIKLTSEHYTVIFIETPQVTIEGNGQNLCNISLIVKDGLYTRINLCGALFTTDKDNPIIALGDGCKVTLNVEGRNELKSKGIYVPKTSDLTITGDGSLKIVAELASSYAIGTDRHQSPGNINVLMTGHLIVESNGDNAVGIGGGMNENNTAIRILSGNTQVNCSGGACVGIGIHEGTSNITFSDCAVSVEISSASCVGVGSINGQTNITAENIALVTTLTGMSMCALGSVEGSDGYISFVSGRMVSSLRGRTINCIGTRGGNVGIDISHAAMDLNCEGANISGIGDCEGDGNVTITDSELMLNFRTRNGFGLGSRNGILKVINCREDVKINE